MTGPSVSVILPVYNGQDTLGQALESVLAQEYHPLEIVVVDDGSTDNTRQIAEAFPQVVFLSQANQGPSAARNRGLQAASGELIAFIDDDDLWPPGKLAWQVGRLVADPTLELVLGRVQWEGLKQFTEPVVGFQFGAAVCRRSLIEAVGLIDEKLPMSEDVDWFMRIREQGRRFEISSQLALRYRRHPENMTADSYLSGQHLARALKHSLDRRRQAGKAESLPRLSLVAQDPEARRFLEERQAGD